MKGLSRMGATIIYGDLRDIAQKVKKNMEAITSWNSPGAVYRSKRDYYINECNSWHREYLLVVVLRINGYLPIARVAIHKGVEFMPNHLV